MAATSAVPLPASLLASDDFRALNAEQQQSLEARLRHCLELAQAGLIDEGANLLEVVDDMELDALAIVGSYTDPRKSVTPYVVHSSWTFECDREQMAACVSSEASEFLGTSFRFTASDADVRSWLQKWAQILQAALTRFSSASSFTEAVAQMILIDAMLASFLLFAASTRLNTTIK